MKKILIVEDEEITSIALESFLISLGYYITDCTNCAIEAYKSIQKEKPDLIITDVMLIGQETGLELAREVYQKYNLPIIFLTAFYDDEILELAKQSKPLGFFLKPYKEEELKVTLSLAFHRVETEKTKGLSKMIKIDNYLYNLEEKTLHLDIENITLGSRSRKLLFILVKNRNHVVSYEVLINTIWENDDERNLDKLRHLIGRLKEKLGLNSIYSIKNIGYVLREENN